MTKQFEKNQLKQAEMQGNELQIVSRKMGSRKMTMQFKKQVENQSQAGYMQNNEPQIAGGEVGKQNRIQTHSQSGRSMIEMLGVLAIIAILSIGGIVGFRLAMNYYQANQIAHEMNIMRTDAQIKIAQGTEKLTLGSPYDENKINFNDYGTDFGCIYMENENAEPSPAFCAAANAYYIELKEIPEGVCRPLANLIDNMDNEIAFYINDKSVDAEEEKGACSEGDNKLTVVFGADSDSNAIKCGGEGDPNCPAELPVCFNHICVQCTENSDCENPKPYCNPTNNRCEPCENDSQCDTTQNEHCKTSMGECIVCEEGEEWNSEFEECVVISCLENSDCNKNGNNHYYCHFYDTKTCSKQDGYLGRCVNKDKDVIVIEGTDFIAKMSDMSWWSAQNFCQANKKELANIVDLNCADSITPGSDGYCHQTKAGNTDYNPDNISNTVLTLYATLGNHYFWLQEWYDDGCPAYGVYLMEGREGQVRTDFQSNNFALCE